MGETQGYLKELSGKVAAGATTLVLRGQPMANRQRAFINRVTLRNKDTANSVVKIYLETPTESSELYQKTITSADTIYEHALEIWLYPGWRLRVEWSTCTAADNVYAHVYGITRYDV